MRVRTKSCLILLVLLNLYSSLFAQITMQEKPLIVYVFDPLCGWCYGFAPVMQQFAEQQQDRFSFKAISGGMITGDQIKSMSSMSDYIKSALPQLEKTTGVTVSPLYRSQILDKGDLLLSSEKPSFAFYCLNRRFPDKGVQLAHDIQQLQFAEGLDYGADASYSALIKRYGVSEAEFLAELHSSETRQQTFAGFDTVAQWGIRGFPAVVMFHQGKGYLLSNGYTDLKNLQKAAEEALKK